MAQGWIRAWDEETRRSRNGEFRNAKARSVFRQGFGTALRGSPDADGEVRANLAWGDEVTLPGGIGDGPWTAAEARGERGFVRTEHVVEVARIGALPGGGDADDALTAPLILDNGQDVGLLWGDTVQILSRSGATCRVRARGLYGTMNAARLNGEPLLELYVIDVGQGDGVLVRLPGGRHLLVDGGLPRENQMTGKNAADFVDWKFHVDYGHHRIELDAMVASHCDYDHYGGLWDLVRIDAHEDDDLDCTAVRVGEFWHAGLSRWERRATSPPHRDDLGPNVGSDWFVRLLGDRADAEAAVVNGAAEELGGHWKSFIRDLLRRGGGTTFTRVGVPRETLRGGGPLPRLWPDDPDVRITALAPVTVSLDGSPALKDLGDRGLNTNGHSVCLRLAYGAARFLLTGDLNSRSMAWLLESYCDRSGAWACDVAKACHHGSADISYRFLEEMKPAATIISSGDAEGYAHPRPEIVAASAVTGHVTVDREEDRLVTPLVYMTEIERSVALGLVTHIGFRDHPADGGTRLSGTLFGMPFDEISDRAYPTRADREAMAAHPGRADVIERSAVDREREALRELDRRQRATRTRADYHYRMVHRLFNVQYGIQSVWRSRVMTKNHYGLVNVRTDGTTVMCATMKESGSGWTVHRFPARFGMCGDEP